jgi:hypothetical protein
MSVSISHINTVTEQHIYDIYSQFMMLPTLPAEALLRLRNMYNGHGGGGHGGGGHGGGGGRHAEDEYYFEDASTSQLVLYLLQMNRHVAGSTRNDIVEACCRLAINDNLFEAEVEMAVDAFDRHIGFARGIISRLEQCKEHIGGGDDGGGQSGGESGGDENIFLCELCDSLIGDLERFIVVMAQRMEEVGIGGSQI